MSDAPTLRFWLLTLPALTEPDLPVQVWKSPYQWSGADGWTPWGNCVRMAVVAVDEAQARFLAATEDCGIWLDPLYALCVPVDPTISGVVVAERGGAENE